MTKYVFIILMLVFLFTNAQVPSEQWARAGGGVQPVPYGGTPPFESFLLDMAVDKWGNVYEVGYAYDELQFTGTSETFPQYGPGNAYITKYDKCGNFQWAIVNGNSVNIAGYESIAIDTEGNIYVGGGGSAGVSNPYHIHTSLTTDTLVQNASMMFQKYDPNGNLLWQQYSSSTWSVVGQSLKFRKDGKLVALMDCAYGGTWQSMTIPPIVNPNNGPALALAIIDPQTGNVLQSALMDSIQYGSGNGNSIGTFPFVIDDNDNIFIPVGLAGGPYPGAIFFGQQVTIPSVAGVMLVKVDKNLNMMNYKFDDRGGAISYLAYSNGALYSAGEIASYSNYMTDTVASLSSISGPNNNYRIYRLDTGTLAPVWTSSPSKLGDSPGESFITATSNNLYMTSSITGSIVWNGDTVNVPNNTQWQALFKFDKLTGHCDTIYIDSLETSYNNSTTMISSDAQGNVIIGGQFTDQFTWGPNTLVTWGGQQSPIFFIEKWGLSCADSLIASDSISTPTRNICAGSQATFTATAINGGASPTYEWLVNGVHVGTDSSSYTTTTLTNGQVVSCIVTSSLTNVTGSPATSNAITVTVNPVVIPTLALSAAHDSICAGTTDSFSAIGTNLGVSPVYQWQLNGSNVGPNSYSYSSSSLSNGDTVSCIVTSDAACASPIHVSVAGQIITVLPEPIVTITPSGAVSVCAGDSLELTASGAANYHWTNNNITTSIWVKQTGTYNVSGSNGTCAALATSAVVVTTDTPSVPTIAQNGNVLIASSSAGYQWSLNGTALTGDTSQSYTMTQSGNYTVTTRDAAGCFANSASQSFTYVDGVDNLSTGYDIKLYPNPAQDNLTLDIYSPFNQEVLVDIIDLTGQPLVVLEYSLSEGANTQAIAIGNLVAGYYEVNITVGGIKTTKSVVKL